MAAANGARRKDAKGRPGLDRPLQGAWRRKGEGQGEDKGAPLDKLDEDPPEPSRRDAQRICSPYLNRGFAIC